MRFLIGILTGTILTLFIATAVDAPTQTTLNKATDAISTLWQKIIERTSDSLFTRPDGTPPAPDLLSRAGNATTSVAEPAETQVDPSPPRHAAEPATALVPPAELPPPPPVKAPVAAAVPVQAPVADTEASAVQAIEPDFYLLPTEDVERTFADDVERTDGDPAGVWAPFHSQMSAKGFAARLSRALDHDFRVERRAAGAYEVVFDAATPAERDALLNEIAELTGQ